jgi:hypothetical protein
MGARKATVAVMLLGVAAMTALAAKLHTEYEAVSSKTQILMLGSLALGVMATCVAAFCIKFFGQKS